MAAQRGSTHKVVHYVLSALLYNALKKLGSSASLPNWRCYAQILNPKDTTKTASFIRHSLARTRVEYEAQRAEIKQLQREDKEISSLSLEGTG